MDTLKRHLPVSGQEGLHELRKIAVRFEEKIYTAATSQSDYLRKISLKMLTMETKSQTAMPSNLPSNSAGNSKNPPDPGTGLVLASKLKDTSILCPHENSNSFWIVLAEWPTFQCPGRFLGIGLILPYLREREMTMAFSVSDFNIKVGP
ncbi:Mediator of RNA polymerase II transcription subunit 15a [Vitis vinifera]|uniref:Mediator of RNA polymerase II transcription subunit 15a n=1 Tax=Vitis vinifera TaxID=29760 RepID=A0A438DN34_VITVI|nr:Mediator of RNA polymerase II transcription subunit 15a [Vitis vinifera]RVW94042.1 Mediator of RNA polymerase II transcription subunit 15a [Vitis vinifera]